MSVARFDARSPKVTQPCVDCGLDAMPCSADPEWRHALADLNGQTHDLANGRRSTLLLSFFAHCVPCIREVPALNALDGGRDDLGVLSVTFDNADGATRFAQTHGLQSPIIAGAQGYIDTLGVTVNRTLASGSPDGRLQGVRSTYDVAAEKGAGLVALRDWPATLQSDNPAP